MSEDKKNRQQLACEFIHDNYVAFNRLRFDEIAQKVQIRDAAEPQCSGEGNWRYITNADINTMVCDCSAESGANITSKEVLTVLNAGSQLSPAYTRCASISNRYPHGCPRAATGSTSWHNKSA